MLALNAEVLPPPTSRARALSVADGFTRQKPVPQSRGPGDRLTDGLSSLAQTQAVGQRQDDCLGLPQFVYRLRAPDHLLRHFQYVCTARWSAHVAPHELL